jgi:hypothetical protein
VAARTFEDSTGTVWEVFEVRRASQKAEAVSPGLERGWLAFVSGSNKRRLAPFPPEWQTADSGELERLCGIARAARATSPQLDGARSGASERVRRMTPARVPRIRPPRGERVVASVGELPIVATATSDDSVEGTVREFAHQARAQGIPAIEAMVRLKALLTRVFASPASPARDVRTVRRWFVEAYYFDRDVSRPGTDDQSR